MARLSFASALVVAVQLLSLISPVKAQDAPLFIDGPFEEATVEDDTYNSGGRIVVNGFDIQVPRNLLVQFPAAYVPWKDVVADKESMLGYEFTVTGNSLNGNPIAAQIQVAQFAEGISSGFIESIDFADGSMQIQSGPKIRISDPNAVFSIGFTGAPLFTADDENPSISSYSGFPMCIPRSANDPLCPRTNRPFQGSGTFTVADPLVMAPFLPGDFVSFGGIRRNGEVICFSIVAINTQINTLGDLAYIRMEEAIVGISNNNGNTELGESRIIGFASNTRTQVALYAMDIDPCTGEVTDRIVAAIGLRGGERKEFRWRADILSGYARDYRGVAEINGVPRTRTSKNGLLIGTYVQPVTVWIHGEQNIPGVPPPAYDFSDMPWLTQGVGVDEDGNLWGPLDPFPQTGVLIEPPNCGPAARIQFMGNEVNTTWVPSSQLFNGTNLNETDAEFITAPDVSLPPQNE